MATKTYVCVGGPKAGERVAVRDGCQFFRVAVNHGAAVLVHRERDHASIDVVEYCEQYLGGYVVWAPTTQSIARTVELLVEKYQQPGGRHES